jgi:phi13 family phage major tail protein
MPIVGVEKLYFALIADDDATSLTYETPEYLPGVKEIGIKPKQNTEKLYAENKLWDQATVFDSAEVEVNLADLTSAQKAKILGQTVAIEGGVYASDTDQAPYTAILYKANLD